MAGAARTEPECRAYRRQVIGVIGETFGPASSSPIKATTKRGAKYPLSVRSPFAVAIVERSQKTLSRAAAEKIIMAAQATVAGGERFHLMLGSGPMNIRVIKELIGFYKQFKVRLPAGASLVSIWSGVDLYVADQPILAHERLAINKRLRELLRPLLEEGLTFNTIPEAPLSLLAAQEYEKLLRAKLGQEGKVYLVSSLRSQDQYLGIGRFSSLFDQAVLGRGKNTNSNRWFIAQAGEFSVKGRPDQLFWSTVTPVFIRERTQSILVLATGHRARRPLARLLLNQLKVENGNGGSTLTTDEETLWAPTRLLREEPIAKRVTLMADESSRRWPTRKFIRPDGRKVKADIWEGTDPKGQVILFIPGFFGLVFNREQFFTVERAEEDTVVAIHRGSLTRGIWLGRITPFLAMLRVIVRGVLRNVAKGKFGDILRPHLTLLHHYAQSVEAVIAAYRAEGREVVIIEHSAAQMIVDYIFSHLTYFPNCATHLTRSKLSVHSPFLVTAREVTELGALSYLEKALFRGKENKAGWDYRAFQFLKMTLTNKELTKIRHFLPRWLSDLLTSPVAALVSLFLKPHWRNFLESFVKPRARIFYYSTMFNDVFVEELRRISPLSLLMEIHALLHASEEDHRKAWETIHRMEIQTHVVANVHDNIVSYEAIKNLAEKIAGLFTSLESKEDPHGVKADLPQLHEFLQNGKRNGNGNGHKPALVPLLDEEGETTTAPAAIPGAKGADPAQTATEPEVVSGGEEKDKKGSSPVLEHRTSVTNVTSSSPAQENSNDSPWQPEEEDLEIIDSRLLSPFRKRNAIIARHRSALWKEGSLRDITLGVYPVFDWPMLLAIPELADWIHGRNGAQWLRGLAQNIRLEIQGVPVLVVDNHNFALPFILELFAGKKIRMVHIDEHDDMKENQKFSLLTYQHLLSAEKVPYLLEHTTVDDWQSLLFNSGILAADRWQWVSIDEETAQFIQKDFESNRTLGRFEGVKGVIDLFDLDIDVLAVLDNKLSETQKEEVLQGKIPKTIREKLDELVGFARQAKAVIAATSPGFIMQQRALVYVRYFLSQLAQNSAIVASPIAAIASSSGMSPAEAVFSPLRASNTSRPSVAGATSSSPVSSGNIFKEILIPADRETLGKLTAEKLWRWLLPLQNPSTNNDYRIDFINTPVFQQAVEFLNANKEGPAIIVIDGAPGSGKTPFAQKLIKSLKGNALLNRKLVLLEGDRLDKKGMNVFRRGQYAPELKTAITDALRRGKTHFIVEGVHSHRAFRTIQKDFSPWPMLFIWLQNAPEEIERESAQAAPVSSPVTPEVTASIVRFIRIMDVFNHRISIVRRPKTQKQWDSWIRKMEGSVKSLMSEIRIVESMNSVPSQVRYAIVDVLGIQVFILKQRIAFIEMGIDAKTETTLDGFDNAYKGYLEQLNNFKLIVDKGELANIKKYHIQSGLFGKLERLRSGLQPQLISGQH